MTLLLRAIAAAFSGVLVFLSFQPAGLWWAAPLGFGILLTAVTRRTAIPLTWLHGLVLYALLLPWVGEFVGAIAWVALAIVQSLYSLVFGIGLRLLLGSRVWLVPAVAAWFVATEWLRSAWPFGGFAWVRITWGQVGGPFASLIALGGPSLVTFAVVLCGGLLAVLFRAVLQRQRIARPVPYVVMAVGLVVVSGAAIISDAILPSHQAPSRINVAAIQGNVPRLGLDFNAQRRAVLDNHARQTAKLAEEVKRGHRPQPDLVMWPENASDVNPFRDEEAARILTQAAADVRAPILVGTVTPQHNRMVVWTADGPLDEHDKRFLQPFGEYMPLRDFLRNFSDLVDRAGNFQPGQGNGVVRMTPQAGDSAGTMVKVGVATCYEVAFDEAFRTSVRDGAQILATPTNNATFGFTDMTYQQLAMSRMRAIEYDRSVVVPATSGVSAIVAPNGEVIQESQIFTPDILQAEVDLRSAVTLSAVVGPWVEWILCAVGALIVLLCGIKGYTNRPAKRKTKRKV